MVKDEAKNCSILRSGRKERAVKIVHYEGGVGRSKALRFIPITTPSSAGFFLTKSAFLWGKL